MAPTRSDKQRNQHRVIDLAQRSSRQRPVNRPSEITVAASVSADRAAQREAAHQVYRDSIAAGQPLSGQRLADRFGYSRSWGRDRINEVRAESVQATKVTASNRATGPRGSRHRTGLNTTHDDRAVIRTNERREQGKPALAPPDVEPPANGRRVAWLAFVVGVAASVAANVMHARIVSISPAAWIGAAFWPIALLLTIEVLARVPWPRASRGVRLARHAGAGLVATVAAVLSYRHMAGLLAAWGEDALSAYLGPLAVDGLMILAAAALLTKESARVQAFDDRPAGGCAHILQPFEDMADP